MNTDDTTFGCHPVYPVFLNLAGRPCLVVGGGPVALRKASDLAEAGARVTVVAEQPHPDLTALAESGTVTLVVRRFAPDDVDGHAVVFAATDDDAVNADIAERARTAGALANAVDNPPDCDFFSGSVIARGPLRIAVSTSGCAPGAAARIRQELETQFGTEWGDYLTLIGDIRRHIIARKLSPEKKRAILSWLCGDEAFTIFQESGQEALWKQARQRISS